MDNLAGLFNYFSVVVLMMLGFYIAMDSPNLVKKMVGLNIFQVAVFIFYITLGKVEGGSAPIIDAAVAAYSNPLPHVLILTAIVVGVATTALGLAIIIRIQRAYGSVNEDDIAAADARADAGDASGDNGAATPSPPSPPSPSPSPDSPA